VSDAGAVSDAEAVAVRAATGDLREAACRLIFDPPGPELAAIAGSAERAQAFGEGLVALGIVPGPGSQVFAAFASQRPVGVLVVEATGGEGASTRVGLAAALPLALRVFPLAWLPRLAFRAWLRSRLDFPLPAGALHVVELHVAPEWRSRGIGGRLLEHAETLARERGAVGLVLSTMATNPARRLYERHGYRVTAERRVRGYRAITGSPGRVLMEKTLAPG